MKCLSRQLLFLLPLAILLSAPRLASGQIETKNSSSRNAKQEERLRKKLLAQKKKKEKQLSEKQAAKIEAENRRKMAQYRVELFGPDGRKVTQLYRDCANYVRVRVYDNRKAEEVKGVKFIVSLSLATIFQNLDAENKMQIIPSDSVAELSVSTFNERNKRVAFLSQVKLPVVKAPMPKLTLSAPGSSGNVVRSLDNVSLNFDVDANFRAQCPSDANYHVTEVLVFRRPAGNSAKAIIDSLKPETGDVAKLNLSRAKELLKTGDEVSFEVVNIRSINFNKRPVDLVDFFEYKSLLFVLLYKP
jgi:hypothetical protein